jgi:hypothetical protein
MMGTVMLRAVVEGPLAFRRQSAGGQNQGRYKIVVPNTWIV